MIGLLFMVSIMLSSLAKKNLSVVRQFLSINGDKLPNKILRILNYSL